MPCRTWSPWIVVERIVHMQTNALIHTQTYIHAYTHIYTMQRRCCNHRKNGYFIRDIYWENPWQTSAYPMTWQVTTTTDGFIPSLWWPAQTWTPEPPRPQAHRMKAVCFLRWCFQVTKITMDWTWINKKWIETKGGNTFDGNSMECWIEHAKRMQTNWKGKDRSFWWQHQKAFAKILFKRFNRIRELHPHPPTHAKKKHPLKKKHPYPQYGSSAASWKVSVSNLP